MKKSIILIALMAILLCLCSCSKNNNTSDDNESTYTNDSENSQSTESDNVEIVLDEKEEIKPQNKRYVIARLNIRSNASTSGEIVGHAEQGDIYEVLNSTNNDKYTWYKIGDNKWIADDGTWTSKVKVIKFKSNNGSKEEYIQEYADEQEYNYMDYLPLESNQFLLNNYVFTGWNTEPDGSGNFYYEDDGAGLVLKGLEAECLYAQWRPIINENICVKAEGDIELYFGPNLRERRLRGTLKKGDTFEILEQIEYDGKIWNKVATDIWFLNSENNYSIIDSLPYIDIEIGRFDKPIKIINNWGDIHTYTTILHYDGDKLVSIDNTSTENGRNDNTVYYFDQYGSRFPGYYYGSAVNNEYDSNGRIIRQTFNTGYNTHIYNYRYDSNNRIVYRSLTYEDGGNGGKSIISYYDDGRFMEQYEDVETYNNEYTFGSVVEYNGNLVFEYGSLYYVGHKDDRSYYFNYLYRYNESGKLIQTSWPVSDQAPWDVTDYYYE